LSQAGLGGPRAHLIKINAGEKQALSQPIIASTTLRNVTSSSDGDMPDNLRLFLSETTPPTPPDTVLHSSAHKVVIHTQYTLCGMPSSLLALAISPNLPRT